MRLPNNESELLEAGEWAKQLVLSAGGRPETAFAVASAWVRGLREAMGKPKPLEGKP